MSLVNSSLLKWIFYFAMAPFVVAALRSFAPPRVGDGVRMSSVLHQSFAGTPLRWGAPQSLGCKELSGSVLLRWNGEVQSENHADPKETVRAQILYLAGETQTYRLRQELRLWPNAREARIDILAQHVLGNKRVVRYFVEMPAFFCGARNVREFMAYLPVEPFALYAQMPQEDYWRGESQYRKITRHPCVTADLDPGPNAAAEFWAVWDPLRESMSEDGRKLFCKDLLKGHVVPVKVAVEKRNREFKVWDPPRADARPLTVKAYFVWNPLESEELRAPNWRRELSVKGSRWLAYLTSTARSWDKIGSGARDPALKGFTYFVDGLQEFIDITSEDLEGDADHLRVVVKGRLREGERPIEMEIFLSDGKKASLLGYSDLEILFSRETGVRPFQNIVTRETAPAMRAVFQPMSYAWTTPMNSAASTVWSSGYRLDPQAPTILFRAWVKSQLGSDSEGRIFVAWPLDMQDSVLFD